MTDLSSQVVSSLDFDTPAAKRHRSFRAWKDKVAQWGIAVGGVSVIGAVMLIFFYLLYEVGPMFVPAEVEKITEYDKPVQSDKPLYLYMEEQAEVAMAIEKNGQVTFFDTHTGQVRTTENLPLPTNAEISSLGWSDPSSTTVAVGFTNGQALVFKHEYKTEYLIEGGKVIHPSINYLYGEELLSLSDKPLTSLHLRDGEDSLMIAGLAGNEVVATRFSKEEDFISEEITLEEETMDMPGINGQLQKVMIDEAQQFLFVLSDSKLVHLININQERLIESMEVARNNNQVVDIEFLLGGNALLIANAAGEISQWFLIRDDEGERTLKNIRQFQLETEGQPIDIEPEQRRKGFVVASDKGEIGIFHSTASRTLLNESITQANIDMLAISPRGKNLIVVNDQGKYEFWKIDNEHPEVSWKSMWDEVWYEGYDEPSHTWQSSSSSNDFEPKYSLVPLAFGTLKGAFYAMLLAAPLAIAGAIYTSYFMAPALRRKVKPIIELMEALPTVILGFLAGLALAPFVEEKLAGVFAFLLLIPVAILLFGFGWQYAPKKLRYAIPEGWDSLLLVPVILIASWIAIELTPALEMMFFGGNMVQWLTNEAGVEFSQRNALIVGLAMGFAVIPTIFSIAEDALFSVPKSLTFGSLALGATPWQTMIRVVLPTASPGIFSALMIGLGRAVGETMIVLMATGNTPITDINIFEGMRTLAANIAVEIPESEVASSHYRILFLTGFVLFLFTFVVNTVAEVVRQSLRKKYGSL